MNLRFPASRDIRRVLDALLFWAGLILFLTAPWWIIHTAALTIDLILAAFDLLAISAGLVAPPGTAALILPPLGLLLVKPLADRVAREIDPKLTHHSTPTPKDLPE